MDQKDRIENEIQKTLNQFDQQNPLPRDPFFYTRLQAQLDSRRQQRRLFSAALKPALLALLVVANVGTATWYLTGSEASQTDSRQELIEYLSDDFNVVNSQSDLFDLD